MQIHPGSSPEELDELRERPHWLQDRRMCRGQFRSRGSVPSTGTGIIQQAQDSRRLGMYTVTCQDGVMCGGSGSGTRTGGTGLGEGRTELVRTLA